MTLDVFSSYEEFKNIPMDVLQRSLDNAIEWHETQDRIHFKYYKPNEIQKAFHAAGKKAKERLNMSPNRAGKSFSASAEIAMHLTGVYMEGWEGYRYHGPVSAWAAGKTFAETKDSLVKYYFGDGIKPGLIHPSLVIKSDWTDYIFHIQHIPTGKVSNIRFKTHKQGREAFQAATIDILHLDEEPESNVYSEGLTRTMSVSEDHYGMVLLTMTPLKGTTPLLLRFLNYQDFDDLDENGEPIIKRATPREIVNSRYFITSTWEDVDFVTDEEKKRLRSAYAPHEIEARTKGIPSLGSGMVYPIAESKIVCDPFQIPDHWPRVFGMDFGWKDPTATVFAAHDRDSHKVYCYAEYGGSLLTPQQHSSSLLKMGGDWMPFVYDNSSHKQNDIDGRKLINLYQESGIRYGVAADKSPGSRELGIQTVLQMMQNGQLFIFKNLFKLLTELRMYARDEHGRLRKGNDHYLDALRYLIMNGLGIARTKIQSQGLYYNSYGAPSYV